MAKQLDDPEHLPVKDVHCIEVVHENLAEAELRVPRRAIRAGLIHGTLDVNMMWFSLLQEASLPG